MDVVDSLSLISLKVASNVFDMSSGVHHLSIRDQIVRAKVLIRDLKIACKTANQPLERLLIVGAGVSGMSAALTASEMGIREVLVVDAKPEPFSLFRGVTARHVGPFMYEWPSPFFSDQSYPGRPADNWLGRNSSPLTWQAATPISADQLAQMLDANLAKKWGRSVRVLPSIYVNVDKWPIREFVKKFARTEATRSMMRLQRRVPVPSERFEFAGEVWNPLDRQPDFCGPIDSAKHRYAFSPQFVILAAGMGEENVSLPSEGGAINGQSFWSNDDLLDDGTRRRRIAIFGGGDGALQDVLRSLTGFAHPLSFIKHLEQKPDVRRALEKVKPQLLSIDRQGRQFTGWTAGPWGFKYVDDHCHEIAAKLAQNPAVCRRVIQAIRVPGRTTHGHSPEVALFVREAYFDKAYLLNRFLVHLVDACCRANVGLGNRRLLIPFHIYWEHQATNVVTNAGLHTVTVEHTRTKLATKYLADRIVMRFGVTKDSVPGRQMIQLSDKPSRQRTTLCRVELPFAALHIP